MNTYRVWLIRRPLLAVLDGALLFAAICATGCGRPAAQTPAGPRASVTATVKDMGTRPTEDEAEHFAEDLIDAIDADDVNKFNALMDWNAVFDQATGGIEVSADWKQGFQKGFIGAVAKPGGFFERLATFSKSGGTMTLLRVHDVKGRPRALLRALDPERGFDYLDFELTRRADGKVRATDIYIFIAGDRFTKIIRGLYLPLAANQSRNIVDKLLTAESDMVKAAPKLKSLADAVRNNQAQEALAIFDALPAGAKKEKTVMLLRLQAAQASNDDNLYLAAMDELSRTFPGDPCVDMTAIDAFLIRKEYDKAFSAIDRLDKSVGGDPYLNLIRANIFSEQGKNEQAARLAQKAVEQEPTLPDAHYSRLVFASGQKKYADMVKYLQEFEDVFGEPAEGLESEPEFAGFVASKEYKDYKAKNKKK
jgi:tetratricopeptide (TPR) repeat protein